MILTILLISELSYACNNKTHDCNALSEVQCLKSSECVLERAQKQPLQYACRAAANDCERGSRPVSKKECESKPNCIYQPANCYCPPETDDGQKVLCSCGGGTPAICREKDLAF